jgi:hypothetical protein
MAIELLEGQVKAAAANGVPWGTQSALVAALSYFPGQELLRSRHNMDLTEDQEDALWAWVHVASDSLASHVPPSVARSPPDGTGSSSRGSLRR